MISRARPLAAVLATVLAVMLCGEDLRAQTLPPSQHEQAQQVYAKVSPSVVMIVAHDAAGKVAAQASGFVIEGNLIVTNAHVLHGGDVYVQTGVVKVPCVLTRIDVKTDLAVLRASVPLTAPPLQGAPPDTPAGTRVFAIGNLDGLEKTITTGQYTGQRVVNSVTLFQISAGISPRTSGGPVVDSNGLVVGVAASPVSAGQNLNFAIPIDTLIDLLATLEIDVTAAPPTAPVSPLNLTVPAALQQFHATLQQRLALPASPEPTSTWLELRGRERDLLQAAVRAAQTDEELQTIVGAATNGHHDVALSVAKIALKRAPTPASWHYFAIADTALVVSNVVENDSQRMELRQEAKAAIQKGLQLNGAAQGWLLAGDIHLALREYGAARPAYELAIRIGLPATARPNAIRGLTQIASALAAGGQLTDAELPARRAVELSQGKDVVALYTLGSILGKRQDWVGAAQALTEAAAIDAANPYPAFNAAICFENLGRAADAIRWYEEALRRDPKMKEADDIRKVLATLKRSR